MDSTNPQVISTGRGGRGNIRSPSRDALRGDNASTGVSPARSDVRGRTYDRETIASIDEAHNTGLVSDMFVTTERDLVKLKRFR
jgi:hypothetical protein